MVYFSGFPPTPVATEEEAARRPGAAMPGARGRVPTTRGQATPDPRNEHSKTTLQHPNNMIYAEAPLGHDQSVMAWTSGPAKI